MTKDQAKDLLLRGYKEFFIESPKGYKGVIFMDSYIREKGLGEFSLYYTDHQFSKLQQHVADELRDENPARLEQNKGDGFRLTEREAIKEMVKEMERGIKFSKALIARLK